jgi:hypothetical protein
MEDFSLFHTRTGTQLVCRQLAKLSGNLEEMSPFGETVLSL